MPTENPPTHGPVSLPRAARHHLALVAVCVALGALAGWLYAGSQPATYTSTARVLVNPSVGNPFVPTPTAVRQDELTSLETEAQVARSAEVLDVVAGRVSLPVDALGAGLQVSVPPNTQILEISYTSTDAQVAHDVTAAVANAYLANRGRRFDEVNGARIDRIEAQTVSIVTDLRAATAAAQQGSPADRAFQAQLATALRNALVTLRAQRTALETSESPAGAVISPASTPHATAGLVPTAAPFGGTLAGLSLGLVLALGLERTRGVTRSASEVAEAGLPVAAAVPDGGLRARLLRRRSTADFDSSVRRLRGSILELDPRPDIIAIAPAGARGPDAAVSEAVAQSFARAGHRVVLVRMDEGPTASLMIEEGLAQALLYERLNVQELLKPSAEPLLCVLPGGFTPESRDRLSTERVREVLAPLVDAGNFVVIESPGIESVEGEAIVAAASLSLIVVTTGQTRRSVVEQAADRAATTEAPIAAVVVGRDVARRPRLAADDSAPDLRPQVARVLSRLTRPRR